VHGLAEEMTGVLTAAAAGHSNQLGKHGDAVLLLPV
jgi:hypothetical protein